MQIKTTTLVNEVFYLSSNHSITISLFIIVIIFLSINHKTLNTTVLIFYYIFSIYLCFFLFSTKIKTKMFKCEMKNVRETLTLVLWLFNYIGHFQVFINKKTRKQFRLWIITKIKVYNLIISHYHNYCVRDASKVQFFNFCPWKQHPWLVSETSCSENANIAMCTLTIASESWINFLKCAKARKFDHPSLSFNMQVNHKLYDFPFLSFSFFLRFSFTCK